MPKIEPRPGLEVFLNKAGNISISQHELYGGEESVVIVHPDDVPRLIKMLEEVRADAVDFIPEPEEAPAG